MFFFLEFMSYYNKVYKYFIPIILINLLNFNYILAINFTSIRLPEPLKIK